jgi:hypothetical protein
MGGGGGGGGTVINNYSGSLPIKNEGSEITPSATSIDFVGAGVNATVSGDDVTVTISAPSGSFSPYDAWYYL